MNISLNSNFTISSNDTAFASLVDNLYSNKHLALVRELISNSIDATKKSNKKTPINIDVDKNHFSIQDFGIGMNIDDFFNIYCVYMNSNKIDDKNMNGGFGIGGKTPFIFSKEFTIETTSPETNIRHKFKLYYNENNTPNVYYNEDDDILDCEIKGTKVSFIIENEQDIQLITKSLYDIRLQYISIPIFFNNVLLSDKESSIYLLDKLNISVVKYLNKKDDYIRLGDFLYPIDYSNLNINSKLITELKIILSFMISAKDIIKNNLIYENIGNIHNVFNLVFDSKDNNHIDISLSRESIEDNEVNNNKINKLILDSIKDISIKINFEIQNLISDIISSKSSLITKHLLYLSFKYFHDLKIFNELELCFDNIASIFHDLKDISLLNDIKISPPYLHILNTNNNKITKGYLDIKSIKMNVFFDLINNLKQESLNKHTFVKNIELLDFNYYLNFINNEVIFLLKNSYKYFNVYNSFLNISSNNQINVKNNIVYILKLILENFFYNYVEVDDISKYLFKNNTTIRRTVNTKAKKHYGYYNVLFFIETKNKHNNTDLIDVINSVSKQKNYIKNDDNRNDLLTANYNEKIKLNTNYDFLLSNYKNIFILPKSISFKSNNKKMSLFSYIFYHKFKDCHFNGKLKIKKSLPFFNDYIHFVDDEIFNKLVLNSELSHNYINNFKMVIENNLNSFYSYCLSENNLNKSVEFFIDNLNISDLDNDLVIVEKYNMIKKHLNHDLKLFLKNNEDIVLNNIVQHYNLFNFQKNENKSFALNEDINFLNLNYLLFILFKILNNMQSSNIHNISKLIDESYFLKYNELKLSQFYELNEILDFIVKPSHKNIDRYKIPVGFCHKNSINNELYHSNKYVNYYISRYILNN